MNFMDISNEELELLPDAGIFAKCPNCGEMHRIEYGKSQNKDSTTLGFVNCTDGTQYFVACKGKDITRRGD